MAVIHGKPDDELKQRLSDMGIEPAPTAAACMSLVQYVNQGGGGWERRAQEVIAAQQLYNGGSLVKDMKGTRFGRSLYVVCSEFSNPGHRRHGTKGIAPKALGVVLYWLDAPSRKRTTNLVSVQFVKKAERRRR